MPGVRDLKRGQFVHVRVNDGGEGPQARGPLGGGQSGPVALRRRRARNRVVDGRLVGLFDAAQHFLGGRVDQFACAHAFTFPVA